METCSGGVAQAKVRELFILHAFRDTDSPPPFAFPCRIHINFRTLNEFRSVRMKAMIDLLFATMIQKLIAENDITMENIRLAAFLKQQGVKKLDRNHTSFHPTLWF